MAVFFEQVKAEVLSKVTIPMYFYNIIVPQLGSYYDIYPVNFEVKPVVCCPLHDEDTPSCRYYPDTESFYCFGCQKGGNVISLHRYYAERMNGTSVDYREAVFFLYDYFIKGKELETLTKTEEIKPQRVNSETEIIKLNIYRVNLEKAISFDNAISDDIKQQMWRELDNIDCLLSLNLILADEAEKYLKQKVRELIH